MSAEWLHPVQTRRSFEEAVGQIASAIQLGDLRVGDRLPSERALAAQLEVSRPTAREAIRILSEAGVLRVVSGAAGGTFVVSEFVPLNLIQERVTSRIIDIGAVLEARRLFEPQVVQMAAIYATESDFRSMREAIESQRQAVGDRDRFTQCDERFHLLVARATGNRMVVEMMRFIHSRLPIAWDMNYRWEMDPERGIDAHEETLRAMMARDSNRIDAAIDSHLSILERLWEEEAGRPRLRRLQEGGDHAAGRGAGGRAGRPR
jgi:GntR family transcriptional regulator, transcriptional repressor for pyruvate dehydrogenase complex